MIWIDYAILTVIGVSAVVGLVRGLVRETFALIGWIAALWVGFYGSPVLAVELKWWIPHPGIRTAVAFAVLFLSTVMLGNALGLWIGAWIDRSLLGGVNRLGGLLFGCARGLVLVLILVWVADGLRLSHQPWWRQSRFLPLLGRWAEALSSLRPKDYMRLMSHMTFKS